MRRLGALQSQIAAGSAAEPALLSDAQVKQFVVDGFIALPIRELGSSFHRRVYDKSKAAFARIGAQGHHDARVVFGELPEMTDVLRSPTLTGALTSVLGADYVQHPHRSMHVKELGATSVGADQAWHKDGHHVPMRHHFPRWIICFYYPHATTEDMGPTGILPGSQLLQMGRHANLSPSSLIDPESPLFNQGDMSNEDLAARDRYLRASVDALDPSLEEHKVSEYCEYGGTVFMLHFGMLHRACRNLPGSIWRNMFKFQFFRSSAPTAPTWAHICGTEPDPFGYTGASPAQKAVWEASWRWMLGGASPPPSPAADHLGSAGGGEVAALHEALMRNTAERERVCAAYALAKAGAVAQLEDALVHGSEDASRSALYGIMAVGDAAVPALLHALTTSHDERCWVVPNAAHALTDAIRTSSRQALDSLRAVLQDRAEQMTHAVAAELESAAAAAAAAAATASVQSQPAKGSSKAAESKSKPNPLRKYMAAAAAEAGLDHPAAVLRYEIATVIQCLGTLGERAVSQGDAAVAAGVAEALLPFTMNGTSTYTYS